ncbi:MAG: hypothetical protein AABX54_04045 [Nanoarchaeota archaeon]
MEEASTLEELCNIVGESPQRATYIGNFIRQALLDEHEAMRQEAVGKLESETIAGYRVIKSFEADRDVLVLLDLNESEDPRLSNPQLISLRSMYPDYQGEQVYHFETSFCPKKQNQKS